MSCDGKPACQQLRELQYPEYPGPFSQTYITIGRRARQEKGYIDTTLVGISTEPGHPG